MTNTNKKIVAALAATALIAISFGSTYAMGNGQGGQGQGRGIGKMITVEEKAKLQSMNDSERQEYIKELKSKYNVTTGKGEGKEYMKHSENGEKHGKGKNMEHSPSSMLDTIPKQDINTIEIDLLEKQYEEEMMANELYMSFYDMYGIETFKNIAESEAKHMEAVKVLLDRYDIEVSTDYNHIKDLYESLKESGSKSAFDALEVGVKIEFVDIDDIIKAIKSTDNEDIKVVLTNIGGGSYNHLRGFLKAIDNNGYETQLDWSKYLDESDLAIKGPIKYKLAEKLESEGVELPEQVSSKTMQSASMVKNKKYDKHGNNKKVKKYSQNKVQINNYKNAINKKYGALISKLDDEKLKSILIRIDNLLTKTTSEKTKVILIALKEIVEENMDLNLSELLN